MEILPELSAAAGVLTALASVGHWLRKRWSGRNARGLPSAYPVRLTCRADDDLDPQSGPREGLDFEVFNHSDKTVTVRGFGLEMTLHNFHEWQEWALARHHPPHKFPVRLEPHDGLDGHIDTEALIDELHFRADYLLDWKPYVDVVGYDKLHVDIQKPTINAVMPRRSVRSHIPSAVRRVTRQRQS
jgi:hypothetical protein